jgi:hypothetical protein
VKFPPCQVVGCKDQGKGYPADLELAREEVNLSLDEPEVKYTCLTCEANHWMGLILSTDDESQRHRADNALMMLRGVRGKLLELRDDPKSRSYRGK